MLSEEDVFGGRERVIVLNVVELSKLRIEK